LSVALSRRLVPPLLLVPSGSSTSPLLDDDEALAPELDELELDPASCDGPASVKVPMRMSAHE